MTYTMRSSKIHAVFQYDVINRDFSIFMVTTSEKYISFGAGFLDCGQSLKISSIAYDTGKTFYILTPAGTASKSEIIAVLRSFDKANTLSIKSVLAEDLPGHILLQLLLNSLSNAAKECMQYVNLTGRLLCYRPEWIKRDKDGNIWGMAALELKIGKNLDLHMMAHSLSSILLRKQMDFQNQKLQFHDYPQYRFAYHSSLRRAMKNELNAKENFIIKPVKDKRAHVPFLAFSDWNHYQTTKIGILYDVLCLAQKKLGNYVKISFVEFPITDTIPVHKEDLKEYQNIVRNCIQAKQIHFVDQVKSATSIAYLEGLKARIEEQFPGVHATVGQRICHQKYNICYIHDKPYYEQYQASDPHNSAAKKDVVAQHITVENFSHDTDAAIMTVLKELVIKNDLQTSAIMLADWQSYAYKNDWIFCLKQDDDYYFMTIHSDGTFAFEKMSFDLFNYSANTRLMNCFKDKNVKGVIQDDQGNLNLIRDTLLFTLPEFQDIAEILKLEAEKKSIHGSDLLSACRQVLEESLSNTVESDLKELINTIDIDHEYDKKTLLSSISNRTLKHRISDTLYHDTGILLHAYLRDQSAREMYFHGVTDINYAMLDDAHAYYCVGDVGRGMKNLIQHASLIREIEAVSGSPLFFDKLLPLMEVEFVRNGQLTVIPFPFKYLREKIKTVSLQ
ncbi:MAG: hypothetical protein SOI44_07620 [Lactimicrobium sp.]|jgi:hypothetical protein|uniref:hypothetical protein n=1 Tax=Lactimicrobium sp. TaxID=2563780 RepID=UPI002F35809E